MTEGVPAVSDEVITKGWPDKVMFEKMSKTGSPTPGRGPVLVCGLLGTGPHGR